MESPDETLRRIKEDTLAKNNVGYFRLLQKTPRDGHTSTATVATFGSRGPCEEFLALVEHDERYSYEFVSFTHDVAAIKGKWDVEIADEGDGITHASWSPYGTADPTSNYRHGTDRIRGEGRTKAEAVANARRYRDELVIWNRDEKPKRLEGCYCQPRSNPCGVCERHRIDRKKKRCGCPHCKGDHRIFIQATENC